MVDRRKHLFVGVLILFVGCRSAFQTSDQEWIADFHRTDLLAIRSFDQTIEISDPDAIQRLLKIYTRVDWKRYWHTLPSSMADHSICLVADGRRLRTFGYDGSLWESTSYDDVRVAEIDAEDREWLDSLFAQVSPSQGHVE